MAQKQPNLALSVSSRTFSNPNDVRLFSGVIEQLYAIREEGGEIEEMEVEFDNF